MNHAPDSPPLTLRQLELLEAIKAEKEKIKTLPPWDPKTGTWVPEFYEIQKRIDDLSVKALRSGVLRGRPAESRRPGFRLEFREIADFPGELEMLVLPNAGDFHPELPRWAVNHFVEWIQLQRSLRKEGRETLRKTKIVGLETGMRRPKDLNLLTRVLELRGFELSKVEEKKLIRVRKERGSWNWVMGVCTSLSYILYVVFHSANDFTTCNRFNGYGLLNKAVKEFSSGA